MQVDHAAIWSEVEKLRGETKDLKSGMTQLNGKLDSLFERLAGKLDTLAAVLAERHEFQKKIAQDVNTLYERMRQTETRLSTINHEELQAKVANVEKKQGKHGERLAQVAIVAALGGIFLSALVPKALDRIMSPNRSLAPAYGEIAAMG